MPIERAAPPTPAATATATATAPPGARLAALDVLRGFALCGILLVNIGPVAHFGYDVPHGPPTLDDAGGWLQLLVQQRFHPVFALLFGAGFSLFLASAARRSARPRVVLLRRLLVLLPLGVLHQFWHPGEALVFYAVIGLLVLLPSTWLPRWTVALGAAVLVPAALTTGGGVALVPGVFLLGSALVRYGVVARVEDSTGIPLLLFAGFAAASVPALAWQLQDLAGSGFTASSAVAGFLLAGAYVSGVLVLLRTPLRGFLRALFTPLGRTALTNYVAATPVVVLAGHVLDLSHSRSWTELLLVAVGVLAVQWVLSVLWLRRFRQGPLEWLWRCATWGRREPLRRA
ncbi:hypothetical protein NUM3379_27280 [Kineococcus sp. NUM-3379]